MLGSRCNTRMERLLDSSVHLACIAGPDTGTLIPVGGQWSQIGRSDDSISDPLTSRNHCRARLATPTCRQCVEVVDAGSVNGIRTGRTWHPLPGFAPTWVALRAQRQATVPIGNIVLIGGNLFEVRQLPAPLSLDTLTNRNDSRRTRGWRVWIIAAPLLSLTWLVARLVSWTVAGMALSVIVATVLYLYMAWRSRQRVDPLRILYGLELPAAPSTTDDHQRITVDLTPAHSHTLIHIGRWSYARLPRYSATPEKSMTIAHRARIGIRCEDKAWLSWVGVQLVIAARARGVTCEFDGKFVCHGEDEIYRLDLLNATGEWDIVVTLPGTPPVRSIRRVNKTGDTDTFPDFVNIAELPTPRNEGHSGLPVMIGVDNSGPVAIDLARDGPHALVAGTTGSGKSEALRTWIYQLARVHPPRTLRFVFVDYKGGATFGDLAYLPHCEGVVTDLDAHLTERAICGLSAELAERESLLAHHGYVNLEQWENHDTQGAPARIICIIDEFRAMIRTHPGLIERFVDVAARGRSLGIHLIAATQSPGGVISAHMRANLTLRVCFRTAQISESVDVLGSADAAQLPRIPGRARISELSSPVQWAYTDQHDINAIIGTRRSEPTLWKRPLSRTLSVSSAVLIVPPQSEHLFAVADDIDARRYVPLVAERGLVQVVADGDRKSHILNTIGTQFIHAIHLTDRAVKTTDVSPDDGEAILHAVRVATLTRTPVLVDDISRAVRAIDSVGGAGSGAEVWRTLSDTLRAPLVAATGVDDMFRYDGDRRLLSISLPRAKARGLDRELVDLLETLPHSGGNLPLVASGWNLTSPCSVALIEGNDTSKPPPWDGLLRTQPFDEHFVARVREAECHIARHRDATRVSPTPRSIRILGRVSEAVERICRKTLPTSCFSDHEIMECDSDDDRTITVLGALNAHVYRQLDCPLGVRPGAHVWVKWSGWWHKFDK